MSIERSTLNHLKMARSALLWANICQSAAESDTDAWRLSTLQAIRKGMKHWEAIQRSCCEIMADPDSRQKSAESSSELSDDEDEEFINNASNSFSLSPTHNSKFKWATKFQWRDLCTVAVVVIVNTSLTEQLPLIAGKTQPQLLSSLFSKKLSSSTDSWALPGCSPEATICICLLSKWVLSVLALALPTPTGVVAPTMIIGALIGRTFVALVPSSLQDMLLSTEGETITDDMRGAFAARFAIVGAAAFCAGIARAFSMAITVFEVLALPNSVLPLSCASLASIFVANEIGVPGFFDQILTNKGFHGVPAITSQKKSMLPVARVMRRVDHHSECLSHRASLSDMQRLLSNSPADTDSFPIVHHISGGVEALLIGTIAREGIQQILDMRQRWEREAVVDFLEPSQWLHEAQSGQHALMNRMPLHVSPTTEVKNVFLLLKVRSEENVVYVCSKGRLLGVITRKELLGRKD